MDGTQSVVDLKFSPGNKPLGDPRKVVSVFRHDGIDYVKVMMHRQFEKFEKSVMITTREYLPLVFDIYQFKQTFSGGGHDKLMDELEERLAELRTNISWVQRFSEWLQPISGCLPFGNDDHAMVRSFELMHPESNSNTPNSETHSCASQQPMISMRNTMDHAFVKKSKGDYVCTSSCGEGSCAISQFDWN